MESNQPTLIPGSNRTTLAEEFARRGYTRGVEIGTGSGVYSEILCRTIPNLKLITIDRFECYPGNIDYPRQDVLDKDRSTATGTCKCKTRR